MLGLKPSKYHIEILEHKTDSAKWKNRSGKTGRVSFFFGVLGAASLFAQLSQSIAKTGSAVKKGAKWFTFLSKLYIVQLKKFTKLSLAVILVKTIK